MHIKFKVDLFSHHTLREVLFVADLLLKVVDSLKPLHRLDTYAKLDLLFRLAQRKFIMSSLKSTAKSE